jgi:magnesium transporter
MSSSKSQKKKEKRSILSLPKRTRVNTGLPPGSLVFTGKKRQETTSVILMQYNPEGEIHEQSQTDALPSPVAEETLIWYDLRGLHNIELIKELGERYEVHPLILEDILDINQRPKFEEYDNGLFLIAQALQFDNEKLQLKTEQVAIYIGQNFVLSFQEDDSDLFTAVRQRISSGRGKIKKRGSDYLGYALVDSIVDDYYLVLDQLEGVLDQLEEAILFNAGKENKAKIHNLKLQSINLRKMVAPLREAISRFSKTESPLLNEGTAIFIRDLYDHSAQVMDSIESYRDVMNGLYDLYLSEISLKMNNIMQVLTIISTIFIPLTFLAGIYGMNFEHMPELRWKYSYYVLWGIMIILGIGLLLYFRRRNWL